MSITGTIIIKVQFLLVDLNIYIVFIDIFFSNFDSFRYAFTSTRGLFKNEGKYIKNIHMENIGKYKYLKVKKYIFLCINLKFIS